MSLSSENRHVPGSIFVFTTLRCHQTWQAGKLFMKVIHGNYIYIAGKIAGKINYGWNQLRMILIYATVILLLSVAFSRWRRLNDFSLTAPRHHWARRTWRLWAQRGCNNPHLSRHDWPNTKLWELRAPSSPMVSRLPVRCISLSLYLRTNPSPSSICNKY